MRLSGTVSNSMGRVEVYYRGEWGTICDSKWDITAANIVCKQLGYIRAERPSLRSEFGPTWKPFWMDYVRCRGNETSLFNCAHNGWGVSQCSHLNEAGVVCTSKCNT